MASLIPTGDPIRMPVPYNAGALWHLVGRVVCANGALYFVLGGRGAPPAEMEVDVQPMREAEHDCGIDWRALYREPIDLGAVRLA